MTFSGDPFRTLGLHPGSSEEQIKRAYRTLAKRYRPDSAGEAALPRFLAIQAAYDMLTGTIRHPRPGTAGGNPSGARPQAGSAGGTANRRSAGSSGPEGSAGPGSKADPSRTQATRDAYRARRRGSTGGATRESGPSGAPDSTGAPGWWAGGRTGGGASYDPQRGAAGEGADAAPGAASGPRRPRRTPKVATLGSTSYDDAPSEPEPEWDGATWYGGGS